MADTALRILGICGSLRRKSFNLAALRAGQSVGARRRARERAQAVLGSRCRDADGWPTP
jgi:NAD(P)H-dependent FMN reductase